jgi:DNA polymerase-3 subunit gamma/tau
MAYEVTATRKRPQLFDGLKGQEFVVSTIKNAIGQGRTAHAYLFSGPRGVGKTTSARILAKALNCEHGPTAFPCGVCANCKEIAQGNSMDVIEIDGASNTSVNDVRVIKDEVLFPPQNSRYKVYIIDEVHMLSTSAFNALLKTIEEPPEYVVFIFATTETQKVPATIRSRCQQFHFQLIPLDTIKQLLAETAQEMGIPADEDALFWIAKESTGSMRDAYTLFDQVVSFCDGAITLEKIHQKLGLVGLDQITQVVGELLAGEPDSAITSLHELMGAGVSVEQCIKDLTEYFRTLLLLKKGIRNEDILGIQPQRIPEAIRNAYTEEQLEAAVELFLQLYRDIRYSLSPRFELELAVSRLGSLPYLVSATQLMKQLAILKNDLVQGKTTEPPKTREPLELRTPIAQKTNNTSSKVSEPQNRAIVEPTVTPQPKVFPPSVQTVVPVKIEAPPVQVAPITIPVAPTIKAPVATQIPVPVAPPQAAPAPAAPKPQVKITKDLLPKLIQEMAHERDPAGIILSQVVDIVHDDKQVLIVFSSRYALQTAKQNEEKLRALIYRTAGYEGPLNFSVQEAKPVAKPEDKHKNDTTVHTIASLFRGEII